MDTREFLELVTPSGLRCITVKYPVGFANLPAATVEDAIRIASASDAKQLNTYFALASFKEEHLNEKSKRRVKRKRTNVDQLKALWLDIDFKSLEKDLKTTLTEFFDATAFPRPTITVHSGNGIHLYWPLAEAIPVTEWLPLAEGFKQLCQTHGLPADHACTSDSARVLRPPGTRNWKDPANPKRVRIVGGSGDTFDVVRLREALNVEASATPVGIPSYLRNAKVESDEFTKSRKQPTSVRNAIKKCAVLKHILMTGGAEQSEPEWNATLMLLAHIDDGAKVVHPMSCKHPGYDAQETMAKWQAKIEAKETGSGPTLCSTFEDYHGDLCKACPFYKSKKVKTPLSLAYAEVADSAVEAAAETGASPRPQAMILANVSQMNAHMPFGWRIDGNGLGIEREVWDPKAGEKVWEHALNDIWTLEEACRTTAEREFSLKLVNKHKNNVITLELPTDALASNQRVGEYIGRYGAPITAAKEMQNFRDLMSTWLRELRAKAEVKDTTDQLGWIETVDEATNNHTTLGFATGRHAFYTDGTERSGVVSANSKHKGIEASYAPVGELDRWKDCAEFIVQQGCPHLITMLASAFAGPLVRFTGLNGCVVSIVSPNSGAGKTTGMDIAQAVWAHPKNAPATIQDTPTTVKNKLAYVQNITAYWDEVRGNDEVMNAFLQIAFQVTQGKDRERADRMARTIAAQTWKTMLLTASNDSIFDIAASSLDSSDAGVYRIFELLVENHEYPKLDMRLQTMVAELQDNYGLAGMVYAKYLVDNMDAIAADVEAFTKKLATSLKQTAPERFWIATIATLVCGARYAGQAGLVTIDERSLLSYLVNGLHKLRARANDGKSSTSPRELIAAYQMQHMHEALWVDKLKRGAGASSYDPVLINPNNLRKVTYQVGRDQGIMRVVKSDFTRWLKQSRGLKWNPALRDKFVEDVDLTEGKYILGLGTKFATSRTMCFDFALDINDLTPPQKEEDDAK